MGQLGTRVWEKDTKTHQRRRIVLDAQTLALLRAYLSHRAQRGALLGVDLAEDAFVFSARPDGSASIRPAGVTQRYHRMCQRLGWDMHIHQLRHFSATELIAAGVDIRTVAGRLGHSGGGTTTLRVYSAWVAEADQRAADSLAARLPGVASVDWLDDLGALPPPRSEDIEDYAAPYQHIAADLRGSIRCGALAPGTTVPTVKELSTRYQVAVGTAHRALTLLRDQGLIEIQRGRRGVVLPDASAS